VSGIRGTNVAIEAPWRRRLLRYYFKLLPWILLVALLTVGTSAVAQGQNPYITFAVAGGIYVLVEAGRWLPFLLGTPLTRSMLRISAWSLLDLAALLAGRNRPALTKEWHTHLAGESGHDPITRRKVKEALGFVASAIRCRCSDAADAAWTPVDAILISRKLSNLLVLGPTTMAAVFILRHAGTLGVVTSAESISAIGVALYGLVRVGRWWRNVKPPEPKARSVKE
jgi:hypothetical protein